MLEAADSSADAYSAVCEAADVVLAVVAVADSWTVTDCLAVADCLVVADS